MEWKKEWKIVLKRVSYKGKYVDLQNQSQEFDSPHSCIKSKSVPTNYLYPKKGCFTLKKPKNNQVSKIKGGYTHKIKGGYTQKSASIPKVQILPL